VTGPPKSIALSSNASLIYSPAFLSESEATTLMDHCKTIADWEQSTIVIFGKQVQIPRLNIWYGDEPYSYSGKTFAAREWTTDLFNLKEKIETHTALPFNSMLGNWYRDGKDCMGWHSDNEISLGQNPQIASISLGATRRFVLRNKKDKKSKVRLELQNGSLLMMLGDTQHHWQHSLPRMARLTEPRFNLTFRRIADPIVARPKP